MRRALMVIVMFLLAAALMACGAGAVPSTPASPAGAAPLVIAAGATHRTIHVAVGRRLLVRLDMLTWSFHPVSGRAVRQRGAQHMVRRTHGCTAPNGCGTVELALVAVARGRSVVTATRGLCGEDYICPRAQRTFTLTITVD